MWERVGVRGSCSGRVKNIRGASRARRRKHKHKPKRLSIHVEQMTADGRAEGFSLFMLAISSTFHVMILS